MHSHQLTEELENGITGKISRKCPRLVKIIQGLSEDGVVIDEPMEFIKAIVDGIERGVILSNDIVNGLAVLLHRNSHLINAFCEQLPQIQHRWLSSIQLIIFVRLLEKIKLGLYSTNRNYWDALTRYQLILLSVIAQNNERPKFKKVISYLFKNHASDVLTLFENATDAEVERNLFGGLYILGYRISHGEGEHIARLEKLAVKLILNSVLNSRQLIDPAYLKAIQSISFSVSQESFDESIKPKIQNTLKLRSESCIGTVSKLFHGLTHININAYSKDIFFAEPMMKCLTSATDPIRALALDFVKVVSKMCTQAEVALALWQHLQDGIQGTSSLGKQITSQPYQRTSFFDAMGDLSICIDTELIDPSGKTSHTPIRTTMEKNDAMRLATTVIKKLVALVNTEATYGVKMAGMRALSRWIVISRAEYDNDMNLSSIVDGIATQGQNSCAYITGVSWIVAGASESIRNAIGDAIVKSSSGAAKSPCYVADATGASTSTSSTAEKAKSSTTTTTKKTAAPATAAKKGKKSNLDDLEAEMLNMKPKKVSASTSKATTVRAASGCTSCGVIGALLQTVATGDSIVSQKNAFKEHATTITHALSLLLSLRSVHPGFKQKLAECEGSASWNANDALATKKTWNSLLVKLARMGNTHVKAADPYSIAGVMDEEPETLAAVADVRLCEDRFSCSLGGQSCEEEIQLCMANMLHHVIPNVEKETPFIIAQCTIALSQSTHVFVRQQAMQLVSAYLVNHAAGELLKALMTYFSRLDDARLSGSYLREMLLYLVKTCQDKDLLPMMLLLSQHPVAHRHLWSQVVSKTEDPKHTESFMLHEAAAKVQSLYLEDICFSTSENVNESMRLAGFRALGHLVCHGKGFASIPGLVKILQESLDPSRFAGVDHITAEIVLTPPGELSAHGEETLINDAMKAAAKKESTAARSQATAEDEWERKVRAEIEAKKKKDTGTNQDALVDAKARSRRLEEEEKIRERLLPFFRQAQLSLQFLNAFCVYQNASGFLQEISDMCKPLVVCPLLVPLVLPVYEGLLGSVTCEVIKHSKVMLSPVLMMSFSQCSTMYQLNLIGEACRIIHEAASSTNNMHAFTSDELVLLFPLFKEMIQGTARNPDILKIWASQNAADEDVEEKDDDEEEEEVKKKKEKKDKEKDKKEKKSKKSSKKDTSLTIVAPEAAPKDDDSKPVVSAGLSSELAFFDFDGESPTESIERVLDILNRHVALLSKHSDIRFESIAAVLAACAIVPESSPRPADVLVEICGSLPPMMEHHLYADLMENCLADQNSVRLAVMTALSAASKRSIPVDYDLLVTRIFLESCDEDDDVKSVALALKERLELSLPRSTSKLLIELLGHASERVRNQAAIALARSLLDTQALGGALLQELETLYHAQLRKLKEEDTAKSSKSLKFIDRDADLKEAMRQESLARPRSGVARVIKECCSLEQNVFTDDEVMKAFDFICEQGLVDTATNVRQAYLEAGVQLAQRYGQALLDKLFPRIEQLLVHSGKNRSVQADWQREGAVIITGTIATFLGKSDERIPRIVDSLVEALRTPNAAVQMAATKCIPPLMKSDQMKTDGVAILDKLMVTATMAKCNAEGECTAVPSSGVSYGECRGAAFGVASVAKGLGITVLKKQGVIKCIEFACSSSVLEARQGGLMTLEALSTTLGMLFEPYIITILPSLLQCFADSKKAVRTAAQDASRAIMSNLSGHGVKLVMPALLQAIQDPAWRTKQAAIRMLGSMAYCAKKQLAACLPQVVPTLVICFTDTHPKIRLAASKAMDDLASVIQNPEVQALVPSLKRALKNPHEKTIGCIDMLHRTRFVHRVDAPSLALLVPLLDRGLVERSTETKKKSALIVGNMCSMISDPKSVLPYLKDLIPVLRKVLIDPVPGVRATAAKAFGTLTRGLGDSVPDFPGLLQWLLETSRGETSPVERSGGAQGLVEVTVAMGMVFVKKILDENIYPVSRHPQASVREGVVWVFVFLPAALGAQQNAEFVEHEMHIVVKGLADDNDMVRDASLRAGQALVELHAVPDNDKLLPVLEEGLTDPKWRIRQSSVHLLGDLLRRLGGAGDELAALHAAENARQEIGNANEESSDDDEVEDDEDDDDNDGTRLLVHNDFDSVLTLALGNERRLSIFASLYLMRCDVSGVVRQSASKVWKSIVVNTGRLLREILPPLMRKIIDGLSGADDDKRLVAGHCLGDIVKKLGDRVLPEIIPVLERGLDSDSETERIGVALGMTEMIRAASKRQVENNLTSLLPAVQDGLSDSNARVQEAAAESFGLLYKQCGARTVNEIVPNLLSQLENGDEEVLEGLKMILSIRSREVMPLLLPQLMVSPLTEFHASALASVCSTISPVIHYYIDRIQGFLLKELVERGGGPGGAHESECGHIYRVAEAMVSSVGQDHIHWLVPGLVQVVAETKDSETRRVVLAMLGSFCELSETDFSMFVPMILKEVMKRFSETENTAMLQQSLNTFASICKAVSSEDMTKHLDFVRQMIKSVASDARWSLKDGSDPRKYILPVFGLPKALDPFLPIFQHALMNASPTQRESAALGLGELVDLTSEASLKPYVVKLTGPLIRIVGDRFPWEVKLAILRTVHKLQAKGGASLRPFLPQLQTTFVKSLTSESVEVRKIAGRNLRKLMNISTRVDPLITDLTGLIVSLESGPDIKQTAILALSAVLNKAASKVSNPMLVKCVSVCANETYADVQTQKAIADICAYSVQYMEDSDSMSHLDTLMRFLAGDALSTQNWYMCSSMEWIARSKLGGAVLQRVKTLVLAAMKSPNENIRESCVGAYTGLLGNPEIAQEIAAGYFKTVPSDKKSIVRLACAEFVKSYIKRWRNEMDPILPHLIPAMLPLVKDQKEPVSAAADRMFLHLIQFSDDVEQIKSIAKRAKLSMGQTKSFTDSCKKAVSEGILFDSDDDN